MRSRPPTEFARLELFCDLVDEYDELTGALPVVDGSIDLLGPPLPGGERQALLIRASALRKFALAPTDEVRLERVLDAVDACLGPHDAARQGVAVLRQRVAAIGSVMTIDEGSPEGPRTLVEIVRDCLYGGALHGDYEKHERKRSRPDLTHDIALKIFVVDAEKLIRLLRRLIRNGIVNETLALR